MVKRVCFLFFLLPHLIFSGEFIASVNKNQVNVGDSFTLNLTLKDTSAKGSPVIDGLQHSFSIHSQQQMFNTVMSNGRVSSSTTWKLVLIPQKEGDFVIPSISIQTSEGSLSSDPIAILVVKGGAASESSDASDLILTTDVSNVQPYKNEPFIYTVRIISKSDLADIKMQKISLDNAIIDMYGEPKVYKKVVDGINMTIIEFHYLITSLNIGTLKIPSVTVQGVVPTKRKILGNSFFDDDFDPFSIMQGFAQLKPFALTTEEVILHVQPPIAGVDPWLPAKSLKIEEIWDGSQHLKEGEPFTRGLKIIAEGARSTQLPSLNDLQVSDHSFKIYADKPELGDEGKNDEIQSYRKEEYTFIPQKSGELTLPEISVVWWDVTKKEKAITKIPARTLHVLPASGSVSLNEEIAEAEITPKAPEIPSNDLQITPLTYVLIGTLSIILFFVIFWGVTLQRKIIKMNLKKNANQQKKKNSESSKREKLPDLNPT